MNIQTPGTMPNRWTGANTNQNKELNQVKDERKILWGEFVPKTNHLALQAVF
jgi:hypothetical protein